MSILYRHGDRACTEIDMHDRLRAGPLRSEHRLEDRPADVPLETPKRLTVAHPFGALLVHERDRGRVHARLGHRDHVDGGVELPVPGPVEAMALALA